MVGPAKKRSRSCLSDHDLFDRVASIAITIASIASASAAPVMTGPFPATTVLNFPDCGIASPAPGSRSATCGVNATLPAAADCASSCLASPECTAYTWHDNSTANGPWALACIFRTDGAWEPEYEATGHVAGRKVEPAAPLAWPVSDGFSKFPTMWFGANVSGLDNAGTLALISKFSIGTYGWQQGTGDLAPGQNLGDGDAYLSSAATHLSDFLSAQPGQSGANRTLVAVYRQIQVALRLFAAPRAAADNAAMSGFWMRDGADPAGDICVVAQPWGTSDPFWNMSVPEAADYWVSEVVGQVASEAAAGVQAVFFDESDQNYCSYWNVNQQNCGPLPLASLAQMQADSNAVLARTTAALNAAGVIPMFSMLNRVAASSDGLPGAPPMPCALPEDATIAAMPAPLVWARFYENFPFSWWSQDPSGPDQAAAFVANAILEGAAGVPLVLHFDVTGCPSTPRTIPRPGRLGGNIETQIAIFLLVQTNSTVFSISGNWYDSDFCWRSEFDVAYGAPLGPATRTGAHSWTRNFTRANVAIDVAAGAGEVDLLA